jgi:hypothetical protein
MGRRTSCRLSSSFRRSAQGPEALSPEGRPRIGKALTELARKERVPIQIVESSFFVSRFGAGATHQGVAVEAQAYPYVDLEELVAE